METKTRKAIPTEYKGVVYRSKSEAMFARYLELSIGDIAERIGFAGTHWSERTLAIGGGGFIYEPDLDTGWNVDFLLWHTIPPRIGGMSAPLSGLPVLSVTLIEYKPSRPTDAYINKFFEQAEIWAKHVDHFRPETSYSATFEIMYGSCFGPQRGVVHTTARGPDGFSWFDEPVDWLQPHESEVRATRFDLEHQGGF